MTPRENVVEMMAKPAAGTAAEETVQGIHHQQEAAVDVPNVLSCKGKKYVNVKL
jgi:hypothetical protein